LAANVAALPDDAAPHVIERLRGSGRRLRYANEYSAMESSDGPSVSDPPLVAVWAAFCAFLCVAAVVDACCISRSQRCASVPVYGKQITFWLLCGALFAVFVLGILGLPAGGSWTYGYFLEYMLSIDNLFVFQLVFKAYSTPDNQVDRALFWGIAAAVLLRLAFFGVGTGLLELGFVARLFFGLLLIYSGVKAFGDSEDEDDPSKNPMVRCVARLLPLHDQYSSEPVFFVRVVKDPKGRGAPAPWVLGSQGDGVNLRTMVDQREDEEVEQMRRADASGTVCKVTPLFLVVLTLALIDVIFAVDSVTAKISSVIGFDPNVSFFLNLSSSAFAMFVLRSLYLVVDMLTHMFRFLPYGVGSVLMFIGVKLIISGWLEVGMVLSSGLILGLLTLAIFASWLFPEPARASEHGAEDLEDDPASLDMHPDKPTQAASAFGEDEVFAIELEDEKPEMSRSGKL